MTDDDPTQDPGADPAADETALVDPGDEVWGRPLYGPGGDDAFVYFVVFGADADLLEIDPVDHRVDELPEGIDAHEMGADWVRSFFDPPIGDQLRTSDPETAAAAEASESCILVTGPVDDPATLDYLRNAIGITTAALDTGAVAVLSLQTFTLFDPERWRADVFEADAQLPYRLVVTLFSDEERSDAPAGSLWVHTRGMRIFGRPDLSMHDVAADDLETAARALNAIVGQMARGLQIPDAAAMEVGEPFGMLVFRRAGHVDDPDFNNVHLEVTLAPSDAGLAPG